MLLHILITNININVTFIFVQFSVLVPESNPIKIGIICLFIFAYVMLRMTGIIGKKNQEFEWKNSNMGSNTRRQSTNDIFSSSREKQRRPSEEALFSSGNIFSLV